MAREGLRVLVVAKKSLTEEQYQDFEVSFYLFFFPLFLNKQFKQTDSHRPPVIMLPLISLLLLLELSFFNVLLFS